jgi:hypothetical protein
MQKSWQLRQTPQLLWLCEVHTKADMLQLLQAQ